MSDGADEDPLELEIDDTTTVDVAIAMISSVTDHSPDRITLTVDGRILDRSTVISTLDLGRILFFRAHLALNDDSFVDEMFDARDQGRILEEIRQRRINENLEYAYEHNPEGFISYSLLYIPCRINNHEVIAMLDTGAQTSILPMEVARRCEVDYLIDTRVRITAVGVGVQQSVGKVHALQVNVGGTVWANPFVVLDGPIDECILGVDWLTKNRATIDLQTRRLDVGGHSIPFVEKPASS